MGRSFTTGPDGKLYQLPDQQFANLYWFRYDWFNDPQLKEEFRKVKGYDLGVRLWRAGGTLDAAPRTDAASVARIPAHAWLVTALDPKGVSFFVAFLPQFLDPGADFLSQVVLFEATFLALAFANACAYALAASRADPRADPHAVSTLTTLP